MLRTITGRLQKPFHITDTKQILASSSHIQGGHDNTTGLDVAFAAVRAAVTEALADLLHESFKIGNQLDTGSSDRRGLDANLLDDLAEIISELGTGGSFFFIDAPNHH